MSEQAVRTFYTSSSRPLPGTGRTTPDGMRGRYLAAPLTGGRAPNGPPAMRRHRGRWETSSSGRPRWPQIVLHDREVSTPLRAPIPPVATLAEMRRFSPWPGSGIGGFRVDTS
ncbi:hypothetical protein GCM10023320_27230 [Pseudonocardia adelaidensis]|uniref:Uncharacterized protein n=1 Tax=Pseudonocardia adelaidensis TaxID=648754 RepID=A0ABP9NHV1_9PSEU